MSILSLFLIWIVPLLLSFESSLYISETNPLLDVSFANTLSACSLYFHSLNSDFTEEKLLLSTKPGSSFFSLMGCALGVMSKNSFPNLKSQRFFSSIFFQELYSFTFYILICNEFSIGHYIRCKV